MLPWMLRPSAPQLSRKPRPPAPTPSGKLEALCSTAIRDVETQGASQADSLQQRHAKTIQHLEEQVIQEEGKSQIDFLSACQAALQASPVELRGALVASYHLLMGQAPTSHPFTLSQGASPIEQPSAQWLLLLLCLSIPPGPRGDTPPQTQWMTCLLAVTTSKATLERAPSSKQWEIPPLYKVLTWSCSEAFSQGTSLVRETREEYFKRHSPNFTMEGTCMTCQRSSGIWLRLLSYLAWPFMKSRKYGRGQMSCNKLTMHWGLTKRP